MPQDCEPDNEISGILTVMKFSPLAVFPLFVFAAYILIMKSSKHLQPSKHAYGYFLVSKFASLLLLSSGFAPIVHTPAWGFQTTGFLQIFDSLSPMWSVIIFVYCHLIMLYFFVQVINTRCEAIQKFTATVCGEEKKMLWVISILLKILYFFFLFSFWSLLLLLGFADPEDQRRLREIALKSHVKKVSCPSFFYMDTESWRLYISVVVIVFLLIVFLIFATGNLAAAFHVLKESKMTLSKKVQKIQNGFLVLIALQVALLSVFLFLLPAAFLALKTPGSESASLTILFFIGHHATLSTLVFVLAHRFIRSKVINHFNSCVPKPCRVGTALDADRLDTHSIPRLQVFAVITETTTV